MFYNIFWQKEASSKSSVLLNVMHIIYLFKVKCLIKYILLEKEFSQIMVHAKFNTLIVHEVST